MARQVKIMVIEDENLLLEAIVKKLEMNHIAAVPFLRGDKAIEYLESHPDDLPDLIWLDYKLEEMDGEDFMHRLRTNPAWLKIPVVVISNSASGEKVKTMMNLGVKQYYLKADYRLNDLVKTVVKNIQNYKNVHSQG